MSAAVPLVEVTRTDVRSGREVVASGSGREVVESRHVGHVAVADADGEVVHALGDPQHVTFVRSTAKPFQATACLELLDLAGSEPSPPELALSWASHRGQPVHLTTARRLLERSGTSPEDLTCPPAVSEADPGSAETRLAHNCSGKHALFALAGQHQGTPRERLLDVDGPLQRPVLGVLEEVLGTPVAIGVDGCGAPAVAVPLVSLARAFASLAVDDRWRRVREAGSAHPELVGGEGRLETAMLGAGLVAKVGAEGVFAVGWVAPDGSGRGLAVKAEDGAARAATTTAAAALVGGGLFAADGWSPEPVLGGGRPAGTVRATHAVAELLA